MGSQQQDFYDFIGLDNKAKIKIRLTAFEDGREVAHRLYSKELLIDEAEYGEIDIGAAGSINLGINNSYHFLIVLSNGTLTIDTSTNPVFDGNMSSVYFREFRDGTALDVTITNPGATSVLAKYCLLKRANTEEPF